MDSLSKADNIYNEKQSILLMQDMPLYILFNGYVDWAKKKETTGA